MGEGERITNEGDCFAENARDDTMEIASLSTLAMTQVEQRAKLVSIGAVLPGGKFEVDAITAGEGNGWKFSADCLRESLPLWEGASCFIDHGGGSGSAA